MDHRYTKADLKGSLMCLNCVGYWERSILELRDAKYKDQELATLLYSDGWCVITYKKF